MTEVVMLTFPTRGTLIDAMEFIRGAGYVTIKHSAVIAKADDGETVVYEDDISANEGAITGGTLGSLMAALGVANLGAFLLPGVGPIIAIGAAALLGGLVGGATGGLTAKLIDLGFKDDQIEALAAQLQTGRVAVVLELETAAELIAKLETDLKPYQVEIVRQVK